MFIFYFLFTLLPFWTFFLIETMEAKFCFFLLLLCHLWTSHHSLQIMDASLLSEHLKMLPLTLCLHEIFPTTERYFSQFSLVEVYNAEFHVPYPMDHVTVLIPDCVTTWPELPTYRTASISEVIFIHLWYPQNTLLPLFTNILFHCSL